MRGCKRGLFSPEVSRKQEDRVTGTIMKKNQPLKRNSKNKIKNESPIRDMCARGTKFGLLFPDAIAWSYAKGHKAPFLPRNELVAIQPSFGDKVHWPVEVSLDMPRRILRHTD